MKKYTGLLVVLLIVCIALLGVYLNFTGNPLYESEDAVYMGKLENCVAADNVCELVLNNRSIGFHLPNDAVYLKNFPVEVHLKGFSEQQIKLLQVDFSMPGMNMGINRIQLEKQNQQIWSGTAKLTVCLSGRADWLAKVMVNLEGKIYQADFLFKVSANN